MKRDEIRTSRYLILPSNLYLTQNKFLLTWKIYLCIPTFLLISENLYSKLY